MLRACLSILPPSRLSSLIYTYCLPGCGEVTCHYVAGTSDDCGRGAWGMAELAAGPIGSASCVEFRV